MNRGDVFDAELPAGRHPVVVITRDRAIPLLGSVTVAVVTSSVRDVRTEVPLGREHGLARDCVVNCDDLVTLPKPVLDRYRGSLGPEAIRRLDDALRVALDLD